MLLLSIIITTFAAMKSNDLKDYKIIAFVSVCTLLLLQGVWTYKSYTTFSDDIKKECSEYLETCLLDETKGKEVSLPKIAHLLDSIFESKDIKTDFQISKIDCRNNKVLETITNGNTLYFVGAMDTDTIPIRIDKSIGIQATIMNPYDVLWERMGMIVLASIVLSAIIIICIAKQIQIIANQRKNAKIKNDFSYAMIHDMKSPISSILIGLEKTESNIGEEEKKHYRELMKDEATHLLTLTKKLLTIAKAEEGKLEIEKTAVELQPMVEAIAKKYKTKANKPLTIDIDLKEQIVLADEEYLSEAISNLVDNAVKYSKEDKTYIKISSSFDNKFSCIRVYDEGIGIAESDQKKIFEKFERAAAGINHTRRGGPAGFGLGLNYVAKVVEAHGGYISLESKKGKYSNFSIYLPNEEDDEDETADS